MGVLYKAVEMPTPLLHTLPCLGKALGWLFPVTPLLQKLFAKNTKNHFSLNFEVVFYPFPVAGPQQL